MNGSAHGDRRAAGDTLSMRLGGGAEAASTARRAIARLRGDIDEPEMETLRLLVTELVANSVKHAHVDTVGLKVLVGSSAVLVEVTDDGPGFEPESRDARAAREGDAGWGLFLVERLASQWGVTSDDASTRVWFELRRN